jgi:hypothetical protein
MTRNDVEDLVRLWKQERSLPPPEPEALVQILVDALADHWEVTPVAVRHVLLAVAAVLHTQT